jgi:hypothetical protein
MMASEEETMGIIQDHGHRGMLPTGYRTRDIKVEKGVNVVRVPEPTYDAESVVVPCPYCFNAGVDAGREEAMSEQDALDGRALYRLREALPGHMVESYGPRRDGRFLVQAHSWFDWETSNKLGTNRVVSQEGSTIAEAADACREALAKG